MAFVFSQLTPVPNYPRLGMSDPRLTTGLWIWELQQVARQLEQYLNATSPFIDAPSDGNIYGRKNAAWSIVTGTVTGNLTETISNILAITGGTGAVIGAGTAIQVKQASSIQSGFLSSTDWNTFNGKQNVLSFGNLTENTSAILTITGGTGAVKGAGTSIKVQKADATHDGYLSSVDWNAFNAGGGTFGNLTEATSSVLTITGGTGAVAGSGTSIQVKQASGAQSGYLTSADWTTFNGKQAALSFGNLTETVSSILTITGGTGAVVGSGVTVQVKQAGPVTAGYLSSSDWNTFNNKGGPITTGNLTETVSAILTITGGTGAVVGSGTTIKVQKADSTHDGYLSSTDWNTFNAGSGGGGGASKGLLITFAAGYVQT